MHQRACHLIDCAIATYGHNHIDTISHTLAGDFRSMSAILGPPQLMGEALMVEYGINLIR